MKKLSIIIITLFLTCSLFTGCGEPNNKETSRTGNVLAGNQEINENESLGKENVKAEDANADKNRDVVDLTALSSTMIYAEVYNMMVFPDEYMGKTIKMSGLYNYSFYDETQLYYHYVIIEDATACCQQGLEFIWNGEHQFPKDYPESGTLIEVTGIFGSYEELGYTYYYIAVDNLIIK